MVFEGIFTCIAFGRFFTAGRSGFAPGDYSADNTNRWRCGLSSFFKLKNKVFFPNSADNRCPALSIDLTMPLRA